MFAGALKSIAKSRFMANVASLVVTAYIGLFKLFLRADTPDISYLQEALDQGKGVICVFWHQRIALSPLAAKFSPVPVHMLISLSRDGEMIVNGARISGVHFIRGSAANEKKISKNKSGTSALVQMIAALEAGEIVAITPDGPRGPARLVQPGVVRLAAQTGAAIVPIGLSASSGWHLKSWDRSFLANPIGKKAGLAGEALWVPKNVDQDLIDAKCKELSARLNAVTDAADKKVGKSL